MSGYIPWETVELGLRAGRSIWLSTARPDGRVHAAPVWFVWEDGGLWFVTGRTTRKVRNMAHNAWVVAHLGDGDDTTIIEGNVELVTAPDEKRPVDALYGAKYVDPHSGTRATVLGESDDLYRLVARRVIAWEYGIVATRTDWTFDTPPR